VKPGIDANRPVTGVVVVLPVSDRYLPAFFNSLKVAERIKKE
jgi:hypothetical protein